MRNAVPAIALPVLLAAALSGCGAGGGGPTPSALEPCVTGHTWNLDVADAAAQNLAHFQDLGLPVTAVTGSGTQSMKWDANGHTDIETSFAYDITIEEDADNVIVFTQSHSGPATGTLTISGTKALATGWDTSAYTVTTSGTKNGEPLGSSPMDFPDSELAGVTLELTCNGNVLTTLPRDGFVNYKWSRD